MRHGWTRRGLAGLALAALGLIVLGADPPRAPADRPVPADNGTFRPTVVVRRGTAQGSGTVIASVEGETLVLTAAHVVRGTGELRVELHRYNLGLEKKAVAGPWPRTVPAEVAGQDVAADVAVVRVRGIRTLPYVARLDVSGQEPRAGTHVTSVGIDRATHFSGWTAEIRGVTRLTLPHGGDERAFLVTSRAPDPGRSGGGLFRDDGQLIGVCVGRAELDKDRTLGIFAADESIRLLLREHNLLPAVARSQPGDAGRTGPSAAPPRVTETHARPAR
jgi:S1-C subfamily serine protease